VEHTSWYKRAAWPSGRRARFTLIISVAAPPRFGSPASHAACPPGPGRPYPKWWRPHLEVAICSGSLLVIGPAPRPNSNSVQASCLTFGPGGSISSLPFGRQPPRHGTCCRFRAYLGRTPGGVAPGDQFPLRADLRRARRRMPDRQLAADGGAGADGVGGAVAEARRRGGIGAGGRAHAGRAPNNHAGESVGDRSPTLHFLTTVRSSGPGREDRASSPFLGGQAAWGGTYGRWSLAASRRRTSSGRRS
jgi:hypothetical protein